MVDYKEATVLSTTDEKITLMQWLQKLTKTFGNAVITDMSLSNDGDKSLTFTFALADGSTKTATATAITLTADEKSLIGELVKTVTASSDGVTFNKALTIVGNVSYQGNGIHQGTESFLGETSFSKVPTCKSIATEDNELITKKYSDDLWATRKAQEEKCYQALKTVTEDFTRTDPVYVRIGDDGEPEIHYTMTQADGTYYFANMDLGNATLRIDVLRCTNLYKFCNLSNAGRIAVLNLNTQNANWLFQSTNADVDVTLAEGFVNNNTRGWFQATRTHSLPDIDMSNVTNFAYFGPLPNVSEVPAWNLSAVNIYDNWFGVGSKCVAFHAYGMRFSFDLSSTALQHDAILEVFNNLGSGVAEGTTLTLGATKLALMSDDEKAIATGKGWTLA